MWFVRGDSCEYQAGERGREMNPGDDLSETLSTLGSWHKGVLKVSDDLPTLLCIRVFEQRLLCRSDILSISTSFSTDMRKEKRRGSAPPPSRSITKAHLSGAWRTTKLWDILVTIVLNIHNKREMISVGF